MIHALIYRSSSIYNLCIRLLYGRYAKERGAAIAEEIEPGSSVLDLCCGTGELYLKHLRPKGILYHGVDLNQRFVRQLQRKGIRVDCADTRQFPIPARSYDYVVMQGALAEFRSEARTLIDRMRTGARRAAILSESVRHWVHSPRKPVATLAAIVSRPLLGSSETTYLRFTAEGLRAVFDPLRPVLEKYQPICGGRTMLIRCRAADAGEPA